MGIAGKSRSFMVDRVRVVLAVSSRLWEYFPAPERSHELKFRLVHELARERHDSSIERN